MLHYKNLGVPTLQDCGPTIAFIRRINSVVDAMNSQLPWDGLKPDPHSKHHEVQLKRQKLTESYQFLLPHRFYKSF